MGIISIAQSNQLYWLGRYTERVYTTIQMFFKSFDAMIDVNEQSYEIFCQSVDIPNIYQSKEDFLERYPFDESNPDSILSNLTRAYDNAIVLRELIGSETLSYIQLAIYSMNKAKESAAPLFEMQYVLDDLLAFWGIVDDQIDSEQIRNIIKAGKRIERIDLYARLGVGKKELLREVHRLIPRVEKSGIPYNQENLQRIQDDVEKESLDYYQLVSDVEAIL